MSHTCYQSFRSRNGRLWRERNQNPYEGPAKFAKFAKMPLGPIIANFANFADFSSIKTETSDTVHSPYVPPGRIAGAVLRGTMWSTGR